MLRVTAVSAKRQTHNGLALFLCLLITGLLTAAYTRAAASCIAQPDALKPGQVEAVFDGDTLLLASGDKVRLIGINTPERGRGGRPAEPLAVEATAALEALIGPNKQVLLQDGRESRDRYGRRLAHVFDPGGDNLGAQLLRRGMGFHVAVSPNFAYMGCLEAAEAEAAGAGRGVWAEPAFQPHAVSDFAASRGGFIRVRDTVTRVSFKDNGWWIQLGGKLGLRIKSPDQHLFRRDMLRQLQGQTLEARGWLVPMNGGWWMMDVGHPVMLSSEP